MDNNNNHSRIQTYLAIAAILLLSILLLKTCNKPQPSDSTSTNAVINTMQHKIDSVMGIVSHRDSLINNSRDTVIHDIGTVNHYTNNYLTYTDTVLKLMTCDSLVIASQNLSRDCLKNDSIHRAQESDLKTTISYYKLSLDTAKRQIKDDSLRISKLSKQKKAWRSATFVSSAISFAAGVFVGSSKNGN